jgi:nitronate monooxygenase
VDGGLWWAGQSQGLIHEIASCADVVDTIIADAERLISGDLPRLLVKHPGA